MRCPQLGLLNPEIPHNTGALIRLSACLGITLNIIHPCGFLLNDRNLLRAGLDYHELSHVQHHETFDAFLEFHPAGSCILLTPEAPTSYLDFQFLPHHILVLGQEGAGFPASVKARIPTHLSIPMCPGMRSLNIAIAGAMVIGEALRQVKGGPC